MPSALRLVSILVLLVVAGCSGYPNPDAVSQRVSEVKGAPYIQESSVTVGKSAFRIARFASRAADAPPPALLEDLDDLQWGVYRASGAASHSGGGGLQASHFAGYETVFARQAASGEDLLLLSRGSGEKVKELLLLIDGSEKLTIIQVRGRLENLLEEAVRLALGRAERGDLVEEAVDSLSEGSGV